MTKKRKHQEHNEYQVEEPLNEMSGVQVVCPSLQFTFQVSTQVENIYSFFSSNTLNNNNIDVNSLDFKISSQDERGVIDILQTFDQADLDRELFNVDSSTSFNLSKRSALLIFKMFHNTKSNLKQKVENSFALLKSLWKSDIEAKNFFQCHETAYKKLSSTFSASDIKNNLQVIIDSEIKNNILSTQLFSVQLLLELVNSVPEYSPKPSMTGFGG